jgi:hypothetical protein
MLNSIALLSPETSKKQLNDRFLHFHISELNQENQTPPPEQTNL